LFDCLKLLTLPANTLIFMSQTKSIKEDVIQHQILETAKKLFHVHGLQKVTMDDVAKAIGKGRSSLYYYYKSKDEIFDAVINIEIREMLDAMTTAVAKAVTVEQKLHAFCASKLNVLRERHSFYHALDMGMDADAISNFMKMKIIHHNFIMKLEGDLLGKILNDGIKGGALKPLRKKEKETAIFVLLSSIRGVKREMQIENNFDRIEASVSMLTNMVMHGLKA
jgi:AcrR family transcriptional regulator